MKPFKSCHVARALLLFLIAASIAAPFVHATSLVNISGMNYGETLLPANLPAHTLFCQNFVTQGDGLNLTTIVIPLTKYDTGWNSSQPPGTLTISIWPTYTLAGGGVDDLTVAIDPTSFALLSVSSNGYGVPVSSDPADIFWLQVACTPTLLNPGTTYALVVSEAWTPFNATGFMFWGNWHPGSTYDVGAYWCNYGYAGYGKLPYPGAGETSFKQFTFGFELIEETSTFTSITASAPLFLGLFLSVGLALIGFGMTKGKEPLAAIFMMEFGVVISYLMTWFPAWILGASFAVLGIMLAYRFRGAINHG